MKNVDKVLLKKLLYEKVDIEETVTQKLLRLADINRLIMFVRAKMNKEEIKN